MTSEDPVMAAVDGRRDVRAARARTEDEETFASMWAGAVKRTPEAPFLLFEAEGPVQAWTYAQFDRIVERTAATLHRHGVRSGTAVHLALPNCPAFVAVWLAVSRLGAWMVAADPRASSEEIAVQFARTSPVLGIAASAGEDVYRAAMDAERVMPLLVIDDASTDLDPAGSSPLPPSGCQLSALAARDRLAVMFTSGTTSAPKGVILTQGLYAYTGQVMAQASQLRSSDRWLVALPLFHANAQYYCFASAIKVGASVALVPRFSASQWVAQARRLGVTHGSLFAAPIRMVLARDTSPESAQLKHVWFAQNLTRDEYESFALRVGVRPRQLYGMTETGPAVLTDRSVRPVADSIGTPTPGCMVKVVETSLGLPGEILVGGRPGLTLFDGYLDDPASTRQSMSPPDAEGMVWFHTGDRAVVDASGRYSFVGRRSEIVKVGGENVSLAELDLVFTEYPGVLEGVAVSVPDPILDEVVDAVLVLEDAANELDQEAFVSWCAQRLSPARRPRHVHVVQSLPRTSVGKVRRFLAG